MPLNPINFVHQPYQADLSNLSNLFGNVQKGFEASHAPHKAAQEYITHALQQRLLKSQEQQSQLKMKQLQQEIGLHNFIWNDGEMPGGAQGQPGQNATPPNYIEKSAGEPILPGQQPQQQRQAPGNFINPEMRQNLRKGMIRNAGNLGQVRYEQVPGTNKVIAIDPLDGSVKEVYSGPSPEDVEYNKTVATKTAEREAKVDEEYDNTVRTSRSLAPTYEVLKPIVNSQKFLLTGPGMKQLAQFSGNKEVLTMIGEMEKTFGQQVNRAFKQFKTQNAREYSALERMIGTASDNPYITKAKVNVGDAYRQFDQQVGELYQELRDKNVPVKEAERIAHEQTDFSKVRELVNVDNKIHELANSSKVPYVKMLERFEREAAKAGVDTATFLKAAGLYE